MPNRTMQAGTLHAKVEAILGGMRMVVAMDQYTRVASMDDLRTKGSITVQADGIPVVLFLYGDRVYAVDNRCPHMGFPLDQGTVKDGLLTCHWHHARFDLASGGAFDLWADDVDAYPVEIRDDAVWVNVSLPRDVVEHQRKRLREGLERDLSLVIAKAVIRLLMQGRETVEPFTIGVDFGTRYRRNGWGRGLTTHTCTMNLIPFLNEEDKARALYHGLADVASETSGMAPRFIVSALPSEETDVPTLKRWFRQFVEVRDEEAAERCIISALRAGATPEEMADMMFAAATDHRYIDVGHSLDFTNKAFEALDLTGWAYAEQTLTSMVRNYTHAQRQEETNAWRHPIDLVDILDEVFGVLPDAVAEGQSTRGVQVDDETIVAILLGDNPQAIADALLDALREGVTEVDLASVVTYAAALRIARFHITNEFGDWDTAMHTFTFANAVEQGLRRVNSPDLLRGVFDAAMSVYLDRFLNVPAARIPEGRGSVDDPDELLASMESLLNNQQQVNQAGQLVADYVYGEGDPDKLMAMMGGLLLREDRNFHTIQCIEAALRQYTLLKGTPRANHILIAGARYLAAHAPTMRSQGQTYQIANRLSRGEKLFIAR